MLTSFRGIAASLFAGSALLATPAFAQESAPSPDYPTENLDSAGEPALVEADLATLALAPIVRSGELPAAAAISSAGGESGFELSGNVAMVSDYRFRGVSFSDGDIALQGGIDLAHSSGFYIGTWGSSISGGTAFGELEVDVYAGWSGDVADGITIDAGLLYYIYPTENELADLLAVETDYFEPYASVSTTLGPVSATFGAAYAWEQDSLGGDDNLYLYTDLSAGIPATPITLTAHLGYTDGAFATDTDGDSFDWGVGAAWAITGNLTLGLNYVETQGPAIEDFTDAGFFVTLGYTM